MTHIVESRMIKAMWEMSKHEWEQFLLYGNGAVLHATVRATSPLRVPIRSEYPVHHRLRDVALGDTAYRVTRLVDMVDGTERLFLEPTDVPNCAEEGVPYWLSGVALRNWIRDEQEAPTDGPPDWTRYKE